MRVATTNAHVTRRDRRRRFAFHYHCAGPLATLKPWLGVRHISSRTRFKQQHGSSLLQPATTERGSGASPKYAHGQVIMMMVPRPGHEILARRIEVLARSERAVEARGCSPMDLFQGPPARVSRPDTELSTKQGRWTNCQKSWSFASVKRSRLRRKTMMRRKMKIPQGAAMCYTDIAWGCLIEDRNDMDASSFCFGLSVVLALSGISSYGADVSRGTRLGPPLWASSHY
jgi:hypothetical protein